MKQSMTKEEFKKAIRLKFNNLTIDTFRKVEEVVNEFLSDKVIITKGENRHPYADVLHKWIEGVDVELRFLDTSKFEKLKPPIKSLMANEYRIKPTEHIWEWQWAVKDCDSEVCGISNHYTDEEAKYMYCSDAVKIEKTKRERKQ